MWLDVLLALPCAMLPKRYWDRLDLPIAQVSTISAMITLLLGAAIGIRGYFAYLDRMRHIDGVSIMAISQAQVSGALPETATVSAIPTALAAIAPIAFAFFTPLGLFATYLTLSSFVRVVTAYVDEPLGDPLLTGVDAAMRKIRGTHQQRTTRQARERLEGAAEPDRRYDGEWAGLSGVTCVIVAARRKPGWDAGTWVVTSDGWFTLGEPFDRPTPNGLRTIYPLTLQTSTLEVLRKGVSYELPPLRPSPARLRRETAGPAGES